MADAFVQVAPDSTGKKIQTFESTVSGQTVEAQAVVLVDTNGNPAPTGYKATNIARVDPIGNDATGTIGDIAKPFLTVQGAVTAMEALPNPNDSYTIDVGSNFLSENVIITKLTHVLFKGANEDISQPFQSLNITDTNGSGTYITLQSASVTFGITSSTLTGQLVVAMYSAIVGGGISNTGTGGSVVVFTNDMTGWLVGNITADTTITCYGVELDGTLVSNTGAAITLKNLLHVEGLLSCTPTINSPSSTVTVISSVINAVTASGALDLTDSWVVGVNNATSTIYHDVSPPVATATNPGLLPKLSGNIIDAFRGDGTFGSVSGGGTVTSFASTNLSPLFTTSVASSTTTPNQSFAQSNAAANTFFANGTNVAAPPTFISAITARSVLNIGSLGTNSNLTGPITSVGVATAVASQTGTGSTFVMSTSPALTGTPTAPTAAQNDNSTKLSTTAYTDLAVSNAVAGVNPAVAVQAATTAAADTSSFVYNNGASGIGATLTGPTNNVAVTFDGFTFTAVGQRALVKNDTQSPSGAFNGVYSLTVLQGVANKPVLTRALDYDMPTDINNTGAIPVVNGTVNASTSWLLTSSVTTVGTDPLTYTQFSIAPSTIVKTSRTLTIGGTAQDLSADRTWLGNVTNDAQTKAAIVPNTAPSAGQILVGNAGGTAYAPVTLSATGGTATLSSAGVLALSGLPSAHFSITVENPTATENIPFGFTTAGGTITKVIAVLVGSSTPSVTFNVGYGTNVTSLTKVTTADWAVTNTTTGTTATLNNITVPANGWLVFTTSAQSGTVNSITVTVEF